MVTRARKQQDEEASIPASDALRASADTAPKAMRQQLREEAAKARATL